MKFGLHNTETSKDCPSSKGDNVFPLALVAYDRHFSSGTTNLYESDVPSAASSAASLVASS